MKTLVLIEQRDGKLREASLEAITAAKKLSSDLEAVIIGSGVAGIASELANYGIKKTYVAENDSLKHYHPSMYAKAVTDAVSKSSAKVVVGLSTPLTKDLLAYTSGMNQWAAVTDVTDLKADASKLVCQKPLYAGKTIATVEVDTSAGPVVVGIRPKAFGIEKSEGSADTENLDAPAADDKLTVVGHTTVEQGKADLTEADRIISGGVSMGSADNFKIIEECADVLGATVGASRAAVNEGYASHAMQVGQTGKTVSPQLYIACGISGAIQHMAGMRTSKTIVAINTNPDAAIFNIADFGLVADLFEVVPALTKKLKEVL